MIKKLQLYTICIVIIVIVLSQFTLMNDSKTTSDTSGETQEESVDQSADKKNKLIEDLKNSKYAQPVNDIKDLVDEADRTTKNVKGSIDKAKGFLDIEKNLDELTKMMDQ